MSIIVWSKRLQMLAVTCCGVLGIAGLCGLLATPIGLRRPPTRVPNPDEILAEANRLSWLGNWYRAGILYAQSEAMFAKKPDRRNELYARVGRLRAQAQSMDWNRLSHELTSILNNPISHTDKDLRLWCLAAKGYTDLNLNSSSAKSAWTEALQIAESRGERHWASRATGELGTIAFLEGNTVLAVSLIGKAIFSSFETGDIDSQVRLLSMLGNGFNEEHRFSEALILFRRAIGRAETNTDAGFPFIAYAGIAQALIGLKDYDDARAEIAKALAEANGENRRIAVAEMLMISGDLAMAKNDLDGAKVNYEKAARINTELKFTRGVAETMFALSGVERQLGDIASATRHLEIGLKASRRLGDRYYLPRDLTALAELKVENKQFREAETLFEEAENVLDGIIVHQHSFEESTARAGSMTRTYLEHFRLARKMGNIERAFQVIERVRGRTVASKLFVREHSGPKSPAVTTLESNIAETQLALLRTEDPKSRSPLMEQLLADERSLAFQLNEVGLDNKDTLAKPAPLKAIQKALRDDELLAEYVLDEPTAFCIVVNRSSARLLSLPAGSNTIRTLTSSYLSELKAQRSGDPFAAELYRVLLAPVVKVFPQPRFIISPDDVLYSLPFEALRDEHGFFVRSRVVSYTPSGTVLWRIRNAKFHEGERPLLAVGAVDYKLVRALPKSFAHDTVAAVAVRGLAELSGSRLEDLPASRDEILAIAQIAGPNSQLLLGQSATETGFKSQPLAEFRVIHLATHAAADSQYPDRAALILGVAHNTQDDGLLQVREIMLLSLNAELVTLSACDTNAGTAEGEAGVVNLEQAFLIAGARAVVASLWNVEDRSTTALMKAFYTHLAQHEDKALALAHAKRDMLEHYGDPSPYYWAPFVLVGEGAQPVSFGK